jgi:hypothetical protein
MPVLLHADVGCWVDLRVAAVALIRLQRKTAGMVSLQRDRFVRMASVQGVGNEAGTEGVGADCTWVETNGCEPSLYDVVYDVSAHFACLDMAASPKRAQHWSLRVEAVDVRLGLSADVFGNISPREQVLDVGSLSALNGIKEPGPSERGAGWIVHRFMPAGGQF